jgi:uncharacterized RmlC-like cupin family protein
MLKKLALLVAALAIFSSGAVADVLQGTVEKIDVTTRSIVVRAQDGTEHTFHVVKDTLFQGSQNAEDKSGDAFHGLKEGAQVGVHYSSEQGQETAQEIDRLGNQGLKASQGELVKIDATAKTVTIRAQDGSVHIYQMSSNAAQEFGKNVSETAQKSGKVTVYYTEQAGHRVAQLFSKKD